jgi:two-component system CheB/CheR fusion protein
VPNKKTTNSKTAQSKHKAAASEKEKTASKDQNRMAFPIVGLGASAGGLDALKAFFSEVSNTSGMAYIVVVHMTPKQPSRMPDLLQNITSIPVAAAEDGQPIEPDHLYVAPPDKEISIYQGKIQLLDAIPNGVSLPIDLFLRSLAQDQGGSAVSIILSGTGTDGTLGVKEVKANDGLVLVQDAASAEYDGMPRSAICTGLVDMVLPPKEMPQKLEHYFSRYNNIEGKKGAAANHQQEWLNKIFVILRSRVGHDFSAYKINTILRRINRRMGLNHIENHETYVRYLLENPAEVEALFRELLIGVTSFFRDADSFNILKKDIIPKVFEQMAPNAIFRAWVPGCSTGEEVYSLAIVLQECLEKTSKKIQLQLFGTDIDNYAIDNAREGLFPASIAADVTKDRLKRFFTKEGDFYRIRKKVRDCVVFSIQDVIKDPPFSCLSLLCCRNLLIYLDTQAQKKLLPLFHYTLHPGGILVLGSSETIGGFSNLFQTLNSKWKIFRRLEVPQNLRQVVDFPSGPSTVIYSERTLPETFTLQRGDICQLAQKAVLDNFAPTAVLVNAKGNILHVQGRTGKYLEPPSGPPTQK